MIDPGTEVEWQSVIGFKVYLVRDFPSITIASIVMSVIELVFLGTGSAYPSPHRGASCMVLRSSG